MDAILQTVKGITIIIFMVGNLLEVGLRTRFLKPTGFAAAALLKRFGAPAGGLEAARTAGGY